MKTILLISAECVQTVCMARSLRRQGHRVIGFCNQIISSGYATRWLNKRYKTPDIIPQNEEFKKYLYKYLSHNTIDMIIPLADESADFLSRNKEEIERTFRLKCAIPEFNIFNAANDKRNFMELCERYGICHPRTRSLPPVEINGIEHSFNIQKLEDVCRYVGFPAMLKPNLSQGAKGIVRINNIRELMEKYPFIYKHFGSCTLQQYVEQPDYYYNVMLYRDKEGKMDNYTIIKIRRFFPIKGGSSCYSETVENNGLLEQCKLVLEKIDWFGFADFDVLEDKTTGELKIIEINPRVPSSLQASYAAGVDFGKVFVCDEFNDKVPSFSYETGMQVRWMGLDVMWFLFSKERLNFKPSWFRFFGKNVSYHDGAWNDPFPMVAGMLSGLLKYMDTDFRKSKLEG